MNRVVVAAPVALTAPAVVAAVAAAATAAAVVYCNAGLLLDFAHFMLS